MKKFILLGAWLCAPLAAHAGNDEELRALRDELRQLKDSYQRRLEQLESRLQQAEQRTAEAPVTAPSAHVHHEPASSANTLNPAVSLILAGTYGNQQRDPVLPPTGFAMSPHSPAGQGFNLGESELGISANIDPQYRGVATLALAAAGGVSVENAYIDTTALGNGLKLRFGRFFSGLGYLNEVHAHAWDFVDQPLAYRSLWNNQLGEDGIQLKWLAPTDAFIELGAELVRGRGFPGADRTKNGSGASVLFAHIGDDVGISHSWRIGASLHQTRQADWQSSGVPDLPVTPGGVSNAFTGDVRTQGVDFVWKYAPDGNISRQSLKLQGEFFRRTQHGQLTYDLAAAHIIDSYAVTQNGWYLQGVYKFAPEWRVGVRYDQLDPGVASVGALNTANVISNYSYTPRRTSIMFDFSPSEFSRLRLQFARDQSRLGLPDNQLFLQYLMNLGAHSVHGY